MYNGKTFLAVIPARGGSKGVVRKNIRPVAGKPLIAWTIEAARKSAYIDRLILSSDDVEIIAVAAAWGCEAPFVRPAELAADDTPGIDPVLHAITAINESFDYVVLLQPTSPLRLAADIDGCIEFCQSKGGPVCVSVTEPDAHPYWTFRLDGGGRLQPFVDDVARYPRRQSLPPVYVLNGAVYVADCRWLLEKRSFIAAETLAFPMPEERSLDVDSETDLKIASFLLSTREDDSFN